MMEQSCHLAAVGGQVPFRGHSSLGFYGCCPVKLYLLAHLPATETYILLSPKGTIPYNGPERRALSSWSMVT